jgi:hypothetical protein
MMPARATSILTRGRVAAVLVGAIGVLDVIRVWALSTELALLRDVRDGRPFSLSDARASDRRLDAMAGVYVLLLIAAAIAWAMWQHRGHRNLRSFGRAGLDFTPGWAVGWWFVPIASLWKPFQTVRELWKASDPSADAVGWRAIPTWPLLGWWWACWIGAGVITFFGGRSRGTDIDASIASDTALMAGLALQVVAAVLAIAIIRQVGARQEALRATGAGSPAPPAMPPPLPPMPPMPPPGA